MSRNPADQQRLDVVVVASGLARSRGVAAELIRSGQVHVDGIPCRKPATLVGATTTVALVGPGERAVGRGAHKLAYAVQEFAPCGLVVAGASCLDVGASTGGFTQVLLEEGRPMSLPSMSATGSSPRPCGATRGSPPSRVAISATWPPASSVGRSTSSSPTSAFISLALVMPAVAAQVGKGGQVVLLVKPQFEVGREGLGSGGVVTSVARRRAALEQVLTAADVAGLTPQALVSSPSWVPTATGSIYSGG
ncbi:MAG: hypothetical protein IPO89_09815 [Actinomycetales bacterium]|nr:hypothetical protein [Candidatus Lutibacillus vidarii]